MKKRRSRWLAFAAAFILLGLALWPDVAYGAVGVETDRKDCSMTFALSGSNRTADMAADGGLQELKVPVDIYQVAGVNASGRYEEPPVNQTLYRALQPELARVSHRTTAAKWEQMAVAAARAADDPDLSKMSVTLNDPDPGTGGSVNNLPVGLYLVIAREAMDSEYSYSFEPYLVSLPGNDYYKKGDDTWLYDVDVTLKAERKNRFGDLQIEKTLTAYNATMGGASFIFQIEAKKGDAVFSDVASLVFDGPGTKTVTIRGRIPAGAEAHIKEVYAGASYKPSSALEQTVQVTAGELAQAAFVNEYDGRLNGGVSMVDCFIATEEEQNTAGGTADGAQQKPLAWDAKQLKDSAEQPGKGAK